MNGQWSHGYLLPLGLTFLCLIESFLCHSSATVLGWKLIFLSLQWLALILFSIWCIAFIYLSFRLADLLLLVLLAVANVHFFIKYSNWPSTDALTFIVGMTFGKGIAFWFNPKNRLVSDRIASHGVLFESDRQPERFVFWITWLLVIGAWFRLDASNYLYHGPRWMGLWDNPNIYGMLMSAGLTLAIGLLVGSLKSKVQSPKLAEENPRRLFLRIIIFIAAGMMAVGLFFSYSRGAWVGTAVGLLYLAKAHGKFKWQFILPGILIAAAVVWFFWNATPDNAAWYTKRMDFGRPSAQHRVAAWKAGFEIMRDHPFGVGWNNAVKTYQGHYSPPEGGAPAITTNDYLMLGTELGLPALLCFIAYIYLKFKPKAANLLQIACRGGTLVLLVAFWFDGGLFTLATASVFWILLELGAYDLARENPPLANTRMVCKLP